MSKYKLICMSFDGEYQIEHPIFNTIEDAWKYSSELGSKWYFYPFHFVVSESGKTIQASGETRALWWTIGKRVNTIKKCFYCASIKPENQNLGIEDFVFAV